MKLSRLFAPVVLATSITACTEIPETSKIERDRATYTFGLSSQDKKTVYLDERASSSNNNIYIFEKDKGYKVEKYSLVPGIIDVNTGLVRRYWPKIEREERSASDPDYKKKLSIGCELAAKTITAPKAADNSDRIEKDRVLGQKFKTDYCP